MLVRDTKSLMETLRRMSESEKSIGYPNEDGTIRFILRNDPEGSAGRYMAFELVVVTDDENEDDNARVREAITHDYDGYWEDAADPAEAAYILDSWELPKDLPKDPAKFASDEVKETLEEIRDAINESRGYKICPCSKYFIKDGKPLCLFCHLTATPPDFEAAECPICMDDGLAMHMKPTKCCDKMVHRECLRTWGLKSNTDKCPLCRQPCETPKPRARVSRGSDQFVVRIGEAILEQLQASMGATEAEAEHTEVEVEVEMTT
jgi:hypothetical protein